MQAAPVKIAFKTLSVVLIGAFVYYWALTLALVFFYRPIRSASPRQVGIYSSFWRQNWHLFAYTKVYNRELNLLIRDTLTGHTDTTDIVQWSVGEKRSHAPFNNYQDALDHLLYVFMNSLENQVSIRYKQAEKVLSGQPDSVYMRIASDSVAARAGYLHNLNAYMRLMLASKKTDTSGKVYSLQLVHHFVPPRTAPAGSTPGNRFQTVFQSPFKPFR